jgi:hypothetical protein
MALSMLVAYRKEKPEEMSENNVGYYQETASL